MKIAKLQGVRAELWEEQTQLLCKIFLGNLKQVMPVEKSCVYLESPFSFFKYELCFISKARMNHLSGRYWLKLQNI